MSCDVSIRCYVIFLAKYNVALQFIVIQHIGSVSYTDTYMTYLFIVVWPQYTVLGLQIQRGDIHGDNRGTTEPKQRLPVAEFCKVIFLQSTQGTHKLLQSYSLPRSCWFSLLQVLSLSKSVDV